MNTRYSAEQIVKMLREAESNIATGTTSDHGLVAPKVGLSITNGCIASGVRES